MTAPELPPDGQTPEVSPVVTRAPMDPVLVAMEDALDRGDHLETRRLAAQLAASPEPKLREAGEAMQERFRPDGVIVGVLLSTGFLIVALALAYLGRR